MDICSNIMERQCDIADGHFPNMARNLKLVHTILKNKPSLMLVCTEPKAPHTFKVHMEDI